MVKAGSVERKPDGGWQIDREWYGQGYIFKDEEAFLTRPDAPCYVAELSDEVYTHHDILRICNGQEEIAKLCFDEIDWQHPETWLDEAIREDEFEMCPKCKKLYPMYGERCACPVCDTDPDDDSEDGITSDADAAAEAESRSFVVARHFENHFGDYTLDVVGPFTKDEAITFVKQDMETQGESLDPSSAEYEKGEMPDEYYQRDCDTEQRWTINQLKKSFKEEQGCQ